MHTYSDQQTSAPLQHQTLPNPLAPSPVGTGALSFGSAAALGTVLMVGGGIGGGLLGAKLSAKRKVGATIAGTLLGAFVLPMIVGPIIGAVAGGVSQPTPQNGG